MAAAVLEIHMLSSAVAAMKPATSRTGEVPTRRTMASPMRVCRPQRCIARPMMKPPMKRKMMSEA